MKRLQIKKLTQHGVLHHIVPIVAFVALFGAIGGYFLFTSHAATPASSKSLSCKGTPGVVNYDTAIKHAGECRDAQAVLKIFHWDNQAEMTCLSNIYDHESAWNPRAENASGAYGIPQALPGSKMATAGSNWRTNAKTQILWGVGYIKGRYGTPCAAWTFWQHHGYYVIYQAANGVELHA